MINKQHYHLIGIGGAGMSALAHILHSQGQRVSGSDRSESDVTRRLRGLGVSVTIGHNAEAVGDADVVVYTPAIAKDNPEFLEAQRRGLPILERPAMLGRLMQPYKHRIAISGAHGKTTTTSMVAAILHRARLSPTVFVGGDVSFLGGNAKLGTGEIAVAEACEAFESFLQLQPSVAVITNVDADHLDYYGTVERVEQAFRDFLAKVDSDGSVVYNSDDVRATKVAAASGLRLISFGASVNADYRADQIDISGPHAEYSLVAKGQPKGRIKLGAPGMHNVLNSLAAIAVALEHGVPIDDIRSALAGFAGAGRRFEILYKDDRLMVVDDYAHHPTEIKFALTAAKSAYGRRVVAVFQPHLYSRTQTFLEGFATSLALADEVVLVPIYAAREDPIEGFTSERIVERMHANGFSNARYATDVAALPSELMQSSKPGDIVMFIGAGDIREAGEEMARLLSDAEPGYAAGTSVCANDGGPVPTSVPAAYGTAHADKLRSLVSGRVVLDEPMAGHTTLGVGGPADIFVEAATEDELAAVMGYIAANSLPWFMLGGGANLLVSDKGIRGIVISLSGDLDRLSLDGSRLKSGSAVAISTAADFAAQHDLCGLEGVGTVPGTVGGAIVMNAGTHRGYIDKVVEGVGVVTQTGERKLLSREDCGFTYRGSRFQQDSSLIITTVVFALQPGDGAVARAELDSVRKHRADSQPKGKSAGCFFKNAPSQSAGKLIEAAGGMGLREGGAIVSDIHANFIINTGNATASDLRALAERVRELVRAKHSIELEYEVRMVGEW